MGKQNFPKLYRKACEELEVSSSETPTMKISNFSDNYDHNKNYAGIIVYHHSGKHKWRNNTGVARGYNCRSFYVYIKCTDDWSGKDFKEAGQGRVHDRLVKDMFRYGFRLGKSCCGGFAVMEGERKYSSVWLNDQESTSTRLKWHSDGSRLLSTEEITLVDLAIDAWQKEGVDRIVHVPDWTHKRILNGL